VIQFNLLITKTGRVKYKKNRLAQIASLISQCKQCRRNKIGLPVPGEGSANARVMFVGEAPGKTEAQTGRPFVGRAGKLLRELIAQAGLKPSEIFITSPVKYLPKHVTPTVKEITHGRGHLVEQIAVIRPKLIVLLGRVAVKAVLNRDCSPAKEHGTIIRRDGQEYFVMYHPAAALHAPALRPVLRRDFAKLKKIAK